MDRTPCNDLGKERLGRTLKTRTEADMPNHRPRLDHVYDSDADYTSMHIKGTKNAIAAIDAGTFSWYCSARTTSLHNMYKLLYTS